MASVPFSEPARAELAALRDQVVSGAKAADIAAGSARFEAAARHAADSSTMVAGTWLEAARLAVLAGRTDILQDPALGRALMALREAGVTPEAADSLTAALAAPVRPDALPEISRLLDRIATAAGG